MDKLQKAHLAAKLDPRDLKYLTTPKTWQYQPATKVRGKSID